MAILLALFSSILWGSSDFEGGRLSKRFPAIAVLGASQAIGLLFGICIVIATGEWRAVAFGAEGYFASAIVAGIAGYLGLVFLYAGLATGRMGVVSPISSLCAIVPVTVALVGGEHLSLAKSVGVGIALVGAFCASGPEIGNGLTLRPVLYAVGAALGFGAALNFMAQGSESSALMTMVTMRAATFLITLSIAVKFRSVGNLSRRELPKLIFIGIADFLANVLVGMASTRGPVSVVMVLGSLFPIMTAVLAFKFLHERLHRVQYLGIAFAVAGVAIISASA
ncbi:MAG: DMT family transporter [Actinomycetota bacterium]